MAYSFRLATLTLFFFSGVFGLVYQVIWLRMFRLVMGNTVFASATVLTAFMAGLALGSVLAGRIADRSTRPLKLYGLLEGLIGIYAVLIPAMLIAAEPVYGWLFTALVDSPLALAGGRFAISAIVLIVPTTMMGATLPLLTRFMASGLEWVGRDVGRLYGLNTLGAAVGAAVAGFVLIPQAGLQITLYGAALGNLLICVAALLLDRRCQALVVAPRAAPPTPGAVTETNRMAVAVLWGVAAAGFASMVYEVAWTRILAMLIGSSVYAFTLMLVAFIAGLGTGSVALSGWIDRRRNVLLFLGGLELCVAASVLVILPFFGHLPLYVVSLVTRYAGSFRALHAVEFATVFCLMLVPTFAMGAVFPAVARVYTRDLARLGRAVGEAYAANTLGAVLGSFAAGFLLIPWLGLRGAILVGVAINAAVGICFWLLSGWHPRLSAALGVPGAVALLAAGVWLLPPWDTFLLTSAPYLYAHRYETHATNEATRLDRVMTRNRRLLYSEEGLTATVTVVESGGELYLKVNGKTDASSLGDLRSQSLLGHLPLLLHPTPEEVLLIGLGSGISLGALELHPLSRVECVEISPEVVTGASFFSQVNGDALEDPRLRMYIGDGRNHVAHSPRSYDVIISQPSNLWIAGMADLFTREFFEACRQHLAPGAIMCSWVQAYSMRTEDLRGVVRTFVDVFPHASMWESVPGGDYFLIGSEEPLPVHASRWYQRVEERGLRSDLERIGVGSVDNLICSYVMSGERLRAFAGNAVLNTDDNATLEFSSPRGLYLGLAGHGDIFQAAELAEYRAADLGFMSEPATDDLRRGWDARREALRAIALMEEQDYAGAREHLGRAADLNPADMEVIRLCPTLGAALGDQLIRDNRPQEALGLCKWLLEIVPRDASLHLRLGKVYDYLEQAELALGAFERAAQLAPRYLPAHVRQGDAYVRTRRLDEAVAAYHRALELEPRDASVLNALGKVRLYQSQWVLAAEVFERGLAAAPENAQLHNNLGVAQMRQGDYSGAIASYRAAVERSPEYARAHINLGDAFRSLGNRTKARDAYERALQLEPDNQRAQQALRRL